MEASEPVQDPRPKHSYVHGAKAAPVQKLRYTLTRSVREINLLTNVPVRTVRTVLLAFRESLIRAAGRGESFDMSRFGTFTFRWFPGRKRMIFGPGTHPGKLHKHVSKEYPARWLLRFTPADELKAIVRQIPCPQERPARAKIPYPLRSVKFRSQYYLKYIQPKLMAAAEEAARASSAQQDSLTSAANGT